MYKKHRGGRSRRVIDASVVPAVAIIAENMRVAEGTPMYRLCRLHLVDDVPAWIEMNYYVNERFPEAIVHDFASESLRSYVNNDCGVTWTRAVQAVSASAATSAQARFLGVEKGSPLMHITRVTYDSNDAPGEFVDSFYRPDSYRMEIGLNL